MGIIPIIASLHEVQNPTVW